MHHKRPMRALNVIPTPLRERFNIVLQTSKRAKRLADEHARVQPQYGKAQNEKCNHI